MEVVGAGFGRTGTLSLKEALDHLGFGPTYHMTEVMATPRHKAVWRRAAAGVPVDWDDLFAGYRSTVDWPGARFWRELLRAYPDAKVVLSVRDPDRWYDSVRETIFRMSGSFAAFAGLLYPPARGMHALTGDVIWNGTFAGRFADKEYALGVYRRHNDDVRAEVPGDRLLVFEVREGWEPLCAFLGVPVPDVPFPHVNDRESMNERVRGVRRGLAAAGAGVLALAVGAVVVGRRVSGRGRRSGRR